MNETEPLSPELRALYEKRDPTDADLLAMATSEADRAMRSLPPHCLPTQGGLPHNPDHANACAHRCWSFLLRLAAYRRPARTRAEKIVTVSGEDVAVVVQDKVSGIAVIVTRDTGQRMGLESTEEAGRQLLRRLLRAESV